MSEKHKSISPSAIQVKIQQKTSSTDEKLDIISQSEKENKLLTYAATLDSLTVVYVTWW